MNNGVDALVICSTLNQITNYLVIKKYNPKKIYNITFDKETIKKMNKNIKIDNWDKQLEGILREEEYAIEDIPLNENKDLCIEDIYESLEDGIEKDDPRSIYWHITGGQRIVAMAVAEFIKDRPQDKWIYMEGNIEKLLVYSNDLKKMKSEDYGYEKLTFEQAFKLSGFNFNEELKATTILDIDTGKQQGEGDLKKEIEFYNKLYDIFRGEKEKKVGKIQMKLKNNKIEKDTPMNFLIYSNTITNKKSKNERIEGEKSDRQKFVCRIFEKLRDKYSELNCDYDISKSDELKNNYPAGYIFEKLVAYKIYNELKSGKFNHNINQMALSTKVFFDDKEKSNITVDELDIVLLSSTGKIINFECKVGGMRGDNAKSHNYTTYRLSGVFGMPILISPLLDNEINDKEKLKKYKKQEEAIKSAQRAELYVWGINDINNKLEEFLNIRQEDEKCTQKAK